MDGEINWLGRSTNSGFIVGGLNIERYPRIDDAAFAYRYIAHNAIIKLLSRKFVSAAQILIRLARAFETSFHFEYPNIFIWINVYPINRMNNAEAA